MYVNLDNILQKCNWMGGGVRFPKKPTSADKTRHYWIKTNRKIGRLDTTANLGNKAPMNPDTTFNTLLQHSKPMDHPVAAPGRAKAFTPLQAFKYAMLYRLSNAVEVLDQLGVSGRHKTDTLIRYVHHLSEGTGHSNLSVAIKRNRFIVQNYKGVKLVSIEYFLPEDSESRGGIVYRLDDIRGMENIHEAAKGFELTKKAVRERLKLGLQLLFGLTRKEKIIYLDLLAKKITPGGVVRQTLYNLVNAQEFG